MSKFKDLHKHHLTIPALLAGAFLLSTSLFREVASENVVAGITSDGLDLGGQSYEAALSIIKNNYSDSFQIPIQINTAVGAFSATPSELGVSYDEKATEELLKQISYGTGILEHFGARISGIFTSTDLRPKFSFNEEIFNSVIGNKFPDLKPPTDAQVIVDSYRRTSVLPSQPGQKIDFAQFQNELSSQIIEGQLSEITLTSSPADAEYTTEMATKDEAIIKDLLKKKMNFFYTESIEKTDNFPMAFDPSWVTVKNGEYIFNEPAIRGYIKDVISAELDRERTDAVIKALPEEGSLYAVVEGRAFDGWEVDQEKTYENFKEKISQKLYDFPIEITITEGKVINETGVDLGDLTQLSQGKSGFWGSALGRKANIKKGLNERLSNILLAPGEEFAFNKFIGEVDGAHGWKPALAIFGGNELVPVPGGGLCQVSTTFYRAIVRAGLEVLEKSNHTLYITYYEEYGNGLDAAVYPGSKDFRFRNNTNHYLFIESYTHNDIGYVDVYGTPIHKNVELIGPFYHGKVPDKFKSQIDPNWNEIAWIQRITEPDDTVVENIIMGKYKTGPRKLYGYQE